MLSSEGRAPNMDHVPYRGSAPALQDLMGGQIESFIDPITTNVAMLKDGTLRCLGVSTPARLPALPTIPTFAELGFPRPDLRPVARPLRAQKICRRRSPNG